MCIVFLKHDPESSTPIQIGANREECINRPSSGPMMTKVGGVDAYIAGADKGQGGTSNKIGTWLGFNGYGVAVAITNRDDGELHGNDIKNSRGLLCTRLLRLQNAQTAVVAAAMFLESGFYGGCNYLIADKFNAYVVHAPSPTKVVSKKISNGTHVLTNLDIDDENDIRVKFSHAYLLGHGGSFVEIAKDALTAPEIIIKDNTEHCTISSSILTIDQLNGFEFWNSPNRPYDKHSYSKIDQFDEI